MIRPARESDLSAIRDLQIASWRRSYAGILPETFLQRDMVDVLSHRWSRLPGAHWIILTGLQGDDLQGFVTVDRTHAGGPYVDNLHVAQSAQGRGVGRALMAKVAQQLQGEGHQSLWLTVIVENDRARAFYRKIKGIEGAVQQELLYEHPVTTHPVHWKNLSGLAAFADHFQAQKKI